MKAPVQRTYRPNAIIRLVLLLAIVVVSYAQPEALRANDDCEITHPVPDMVCAYCGPREDDPYGCWGSACCNSDGECVTDSGCEN